ncbi:alpha/beta fold hydrolase [Saccharopolyspora hattusasensis]|uniref:alpha/beta fold hydrolase n=1 Tax=Saccharopolyspora hattusasensis TaxID=1128679 RepID=UPI003D98336F
MAPKITHGQVATFAAAARGESGPEDTLTPPGNARELAGALSGSELVTLPGAGLLPSIESPDAFAEAVRPRLSRLG